MECLYNNLGLLVGLMVNNILVIQVFYHLKHLSKDHNILVTNQDIHNNQLKYMVQHYYHLHLFLDLINISDVYQVYMIIPIHLLMKKRTKRIKLKTKTIKKTKKVKKIAKAKKIKNLLKVIKVLKEKHPKVPNQKRRND